MLVLHIPLPLAVAGLVVLMVLGQMAQILFSLQSLLLVAVVVDSMMD
jgi:hypothetical protein